jgi:hypothetical protein
MLQRLTTDLPVLFGALLPRLLAALAILVLGWVIALAVAAFVRNVLHRTSFDNRLAAWIAGDRAHTVPIERGAGTAAFWIVMLFVLMAVFQTLQLTVVTEPLNALLAQMAAFVPKLLGAAILALVAWVVATIVRRVVTRGLVVTGADQRLSAGQAAAPPVSSTLGEAAFWLVWLLFLPALLSTLELTGLLEPVQALLNKAMSFLPNLFAAALILVVGWFVATLVRRIVGNLLAAVGVDGFGQRVGVTQALGGGQLSATIGTVVYVLVLLPVAIAALNALQIEAVAQPASNMLDALLAAVPRLFGAAIVLVLAWVIGRIVADLASRMLASIGFNSLFATLGFTTPATPAGQAGAGESRRQPSDVAGGLILAAVVLFAAIEAAGLLEFTALQALLSSFMVLAGHILLGLAIFGVGLYVANLGARVIRGSAMANAALLATVARVAILVLVSAMALRQMGLANEIINLAFGLTLGALAVAAAIAFGLGGRDVAARHLEEWTQQVKRRA